MQAQPASQALPTSNRMAGHVKAVGIVNLVVGVLVSVVAVFALFGLLLGTAITGGMGNKDAAWITGTVAVFLAILLVPLALLFLLAGAKLLRHQPAGRTLAYVTSCLFVPFFPLGTGFAVYAFWALSRDETAALLGVGPPQAASQAEPKGWGP